MPTKAYLVEYKDEESYGHPFCFVLADTPHSAIKLARDTDPSSHMLDSPISSFRATRYPYLDNGITLSALYVNEVLFQDCPGCGEYMNIKEARTSLVESEDPEADYIEIIQEDFYPGNGEVYCSEECYLEYGHLSKPRGEMNAICLFPE